MRVDLLIRYLSTSINRLQLVSNVLMKENQKLTARNSNNENLDDTRHDQITGILKEYNGDAINPIDLPVTEIDLEAVRLLTEELETKVRTILLLEENLTKLIEKDT